MKRAKLLTFVLGFVAVGVVTLFWALAATSTASVEPENGTTTGPITVKDDATASGSKAIKFGSGQTGPVTSLKAFDTAATITDPAWFSQMYADGFRLYSLNTTQWGTCNVWPEAERQIGLALAAGLKVAAYTRDPRCWQNGVLAAGQYKNQLQFFALDIETDPGIPVDQTMVNGVTGLGVRPIIYTGSGMWSGIMGGNVTTYSNLPLWDTDVRSNFDLATWTPNILQPTPQLYGGWNTPTTRRIMVQQAFEINAHGVLIDTDSLDASFLR
jgi:hypothetical protein